VCLGGFNANYRRQWLASAARHGILIKGGAYLESGRLLKVVALDKTGTLTQGKPVLTDTEPFGDLPIEMALQIAASLDEHSTHPVAKALVSGWKLQQPDAATLPVEDFGVLNGRGVKGISTANHGTWVTTAWLKSWAYVRRPLRPDCRCWKTREKL
jgi:cation transport ATPase